MARYIDAELFADRLLNAWDTADKETKSEIVAILSDIVTPILVGTPTANVAPRAEVAMEIFEEIERVTAAAYNHFMFDREGVGMNTTLVVEFSDEIDREIAELKKKYTEGRK